MGISAAPGMTSEEIVALSRAHTSSRGRVQGAARPDRHRPRRGRLPVHARGPADPRLQQPADVGQHRPRRPARDRRDHRAGDQAPVRPAGVRDRDPRPPRARSSPRSCPATWTRCSSRWAAPRRSRTRSSSRATTPAATSCSPATAAYHGATFGAMTLTGDYRALGERARARRGRPLPGHAPLGREGAAAGRRGAPGPRGRHPVRGRRTRSPRCSSRRSSGTNGILIPPDGYLKGVREICDQYGILMVARRGHGRLRADRALVRRRPLGRRART